MFLGGGKFQDGSKDELDEIELDPEDPDYDSDTNVSIIILKYYNLGSCYF